MAEDEFIPLVFQMPDYCGGPTGWEDSGLEHKNLIFTGTADMDGWPFPTPDYEFGDANHDGIINIQDIITVMNWLLFGVGPTNIHFDTNIDGNIDILDIVGIVLIILG